MTKGVRLSGRAMQLICQYGCEARAKGVACPCGLTLASGKSITLATSAACGRRLRQLRSFFLSLALFLAHTHFDTAVRKLDTGGHDPSIPSVLGLERAQQSAVGARSMHNRVLGSLLIALIHRSYPQFSEKNSGHMLEQEDVETSDTCAGVLRASAAAPATATTTAATSTTSRAPPGLREAILGASSGSIGQSKLRIAPTDRRPTWYRAWPLSHGCVVSLRKHPRSIGPHWDGLCLVEQVKVEPNHFPIHQTSILCRHQFVGGGLRPGPGSE